MGEEDKIRKLKEREWEEEGDTRNIAIVSRYQLNNTSRKLTIWHLLIPAKVANATNSVADSFLEP